MPILKTFICSPMKRKNSLMLPQSPRRQRMLRGRESHVSHLLIHRADCHSPLHSVMMMTPSTIQPVTIIMVRRSSMMNMPLRWMARWVIYHQLTFHQMNHISRWTTHESSSIPPRGLWKWFIPWICQGSPHILASHFGRDDDGTYPPSWWGYIYHSVVAMGSIEKARLQVGNALSPFLSNHCVEFL